MPRRSLSPPDGLHPEVRRLTAHWARFWPGCDADAGAVDVLRRVGDAARAWDLDAVRPLGGGVVALVCRALRRGRPVVVKVSPRVGGSEGMAAEGAALAVWASTGAVPKLVARRDDGMTLLLERLLPGTTLQDAGMATLSMLSELGSLARRLHAAGRPVQPFAHIGGSTQAHEWLRVARGRSQLRAELRELLAPGDGDTLIHGDLHGRNVLRHSSGWKAIDPHALIADRHAEIQPLLEASMALPATTAADRAIAAGWVDRFAGAAGLDAARVHRWTRVRARVEALVTERGAGVRAADEAAWAAALHRLADALS